MTRRFPRGGTPTSPVRSAKLPDPPIFTDRKDPTFESWRLQVQGKLTVNADHFSSTYARKTYVFNRTGGDAQRHLLPRLASDALEPFQDDEDMLEHLASIYIDPFKKSNARRDYHRLRMKPSESFSIFYTTFLHLAGEASIPQEDYLPDLHSKLTLELRRALLTVYPNMKTQREYSLQCLSADQELREIKLQTERLRPKNPPPATSTPLVTRPKADPIIPSSNPRSPTSHGDSLANHRPTYGDPQKQALSDQGLCFSCHKPGHMARDCPEKSKKAALVQEIETDAGKEQP